MVSFYADGREKPFESFYRSDARFAEEINLRN
jgi:hypothetical protein